MLRKLEPRTSTRFSSPKVIHDSIWGTSTFEPWEVCLLEHGVFQRLRGLKQTGLAHLTYPTAEHSRFQHTLGVVEAAGRIFDALLKRTERGSLSPTARRFRETHFLFKSKPKESTVRRWRMLLRLAALVHDTGHSVFSHSSERIFSLVPPLDDLATDLAPPDHMKEPGAAEIIVYLMVTSKGWHSMVARRWPRGGRGIPRPPSESEWEMIGRWVMGQENKPERQWLADIISGPLDADKLDYVFRDGYAAGVPVGYDLARLIATVCVDVQHSPECIPWWRLTIPVRGINALEQLVMGRLVLNSYLYHHQKCRAAEMAFERTLARRFLRDGTILGKQSVWDLFTLQDANAYTYAYENSDSSDSTAIELRAIFARQLRVRVVEFHPPEIDRRNAGVVAGLQRLASYRRIKDWSQYRELLTVEDRIAEAAKLEEGAIVLDVPRNPAYADLQNIKLPQGRRLPGADPAKILAYRDWIEVYKTHRITYRVFGPRGHERAIWEAAKRVFLEEFSIELPPSAKR
ncbi:MAG TPA: hypothetical protein VGA70_11475 [Longimicrobiales bacterium]